ncbi:MAG: glycosyltransferase [Ilumatobacteraceae bacterium]
MTGVGRGPGEQWAAPAASRLTPMTAVVVAVPARDEGEHVAACLRSLDDAAARCAGTTVLIAVAADRCSDDTVEAAVATPLTHARLVVTTGRWRGASATRAAAVAAGLAALDASTGHAAETWIANTDADCTVPDDWLTAQLRLARQDVHAVAGVVRLDPATTTPAVLAGFAAHYLVEGAEHEHVHAANLGVRADVYATVGGWRQSTVVGEEHDLWRRIERNGRTVRRPASLVVTTSGRTSSRVRGGFASVLGRLARIAAAEETEPAC